MQRQESATSRRQMKQRLARRGRLCMQLLWLLPLTQIRTSKARSSSLRPTSHATRDYVRGAGGMD